MLPQKKRGGFRNQVKTIEVNGMTRGAGKCTKAFPNNPHWNHSTFGKTLTLLKESYLYPFSPNFIYWAWCHLVWNFHLVIFVKLEVRGHVQIQGYCYLCLRKALFSFHALNKQAFFYPTDYTHFYKQLIRHPKTHVVFFLLLCLSILLSDT